MSQFYKPLPDGGMLVSGMYLSGTPINLDEALEKAVAEVARLTRERDAALAELKQARARILTRQALWAIADDIERTIHLIETGAIHE